MTIVSTGSCVGRAGLPEPDRQRDRREPQVALGDLAGHIARAARPDPAADTPAAARRTRSASTRIDRVPADPLGDHRRRHRRIRLQQLPDPRLDRVHDRPRRRPLDTSAARPRPTPPAPCSSRHPSTRAIALIGIPSARCSRRISAQSSTINTRFLPGSARARVSAQVVNFRLPRRGQFSGAVDMPLVHPRGAAEDGEHEERNRLAHRLGRTDDQVDRVQARVSGTPPRPRAQTSSARSHRVTRLSAPTATRAPAATRRHGLVPGRTGSTNLDAGRRQTRRSPTRLRRRARLRCDAPAVARTRRQSRRRHRHRTVGRARASERVDPGGRSELTLADTHTGCLPTGLCPTSPSGEFSGAGLRAPGRNGHRPEHLHELRPARRQLEHPPPVRGATEAGRPQLRRVAAGVAFTWVRLTKPCVQILGPLHPGLRPPPCRRQPGRNPRPRRGLDPVPRRSGPTLTTTPHRRPTRSSPST